MTEPAKGAATDTAPEADLIRWNRRSRLAKWLFVFLVAAISGMIGEIYGSVVYSSSGLNYYPGYRTGFLIGFFASIIEIFYIRPGRRNWIRRLPFVPGLLIRILLLTLAVRISFISNELLTNYIENQSLTTSFEANEQLRDTLVSMGLIVLFVVVLQLTSMVGPRRFMNLVVGRYFKPVSEQRIFMFIDLMDSSRLARKIGNVRFHEFLSEFFRTLDPAIVRSGGEIVYYVGDAVIVTWPLLENRKKNARCLRAMQLMQRQIDLRSKVFQQVFGSVPKFRVALHAGEVVVGECGDSRKQITFLGDAVNITSRIEDVCKDMEEPFLASQAIVDDIEPLDSVRFESIGTHQLKGIDDPIPLYRIVVA